MTNDNLTGQSFREVVSRLHYPFSTGSSMMSLDGRRVPLSAFYDLVLHPKAYPVREVSVQRIFYNGSTYIEFTDGVSLWSLRVSGAIVGDPIFSKEGLRVGTAAISPLGALYLEGLAKTKEVPFGPNGLVVLPERIMPRPHPIVDVTVEGVPVVRTDIPLTAVFDSSRFEMTDQGVTVDNVIGNKKKVDIITHFNGHEVRSRPVYLRTAPTANVQIIARDNAIVIHKRGDA